MIKFITITNHVGDSIKLELARPELSGFLIKDIAGLGPAKATINTTKTATHDGSMYNSANLDQRDLVMQIGFIQTGKETIEDLRQKSYKYFPIKKKIHMLIETDNRKLETEGYIEANEPNIFSSAEGCVITIACPDPYFYSSVINETVFSGIEAMFEFPFENDSLTEPLLEMGSIVNKQEAVVYNSGDAEVGMTIVIHAIGDVSNITIHNLATHEKMSIATTMITGDTITIVTKKGSKSITLLRDGVKTNILNCVARGSKWFTLVRGDNLFAYTAETGSANLQFYVTNKIVYEGV